MSTQQIYVSCMDDDCVDMFNLDGTSGLLLEAGRCSVPGGPAPLISSRSGEYLYVGRRVSNEIATYQRDQHSGCLRFVDSVSLPADPCYLALDQSGRWLFSAYYGAGCIAVHAVERDGRLSAEPFDWRETGLRAHCMISDPSNKFVFVPHIGELGGLNAIFQFRFDAESGRLQPNRPDRVRGRQSQGPRHLCFHPHASVAYSSDEQGSSVTVYDFDAMNGTLIETQTVSTLPTDYRDENTCSQIRMTPNGRFLYAPNRGHDSIAIFSVNDGNGRLTPRGHQHTERVPRAFNIDAAGDYLFVAGLETARLATYAIDQQTGGLDFRQVCTVGQTPMWVAAVL